MPRSVQAFGLILVLLLAATPALALPGPMSDAELSVTCTAITHDDFAKQDIRNYSAKVELMEVIKGDEAKGGDVNITFHEIPKGLLGPWSVFYYPGEMVWTHLSRDGDAFTTTWWNGRGALVNKAIITELPTKPGETVEVPRVRSERPVDH